MLKSRAPDVARDAKPVGAIVLVKQLERLPRAESELRVPAINRQRATR